MRDLFIKNNADTIYEALGITEERAMYLMHRMQLTVHNLFTPTLSGVIEWHDLDILKPFLALAETDAERAFCSYMAGIKVAELTESDNWNYTEED